MARKRFITSGAPRFARQSYEFKPLAKRAPRLNPYGWKNDQIKITKLANNDSQEEQKSNQNIDETSSQSEEKKPNQTTDQTSSQSVDKT